MPLEWWENWAGIKSSWHAGTHTGRRLELPTPQEHMHTHVLHAHACPMYLPSLLSTIPPFSFSLSLMVLPFILCCWRHCLGKFCHLYSCLHVISKKKNKTGKRQKAKHLGSQAGRLSLLSIYILSHSDIWRIIPIQ